MRLRFELLLEFDDYTRMYGTGRLACEAGDNVHAVKNFCEWRKPRQRALVVVAIATLGGSAASTFTIVRTILPENTASYTVHGTGNRYLICTKFCVQRDVNGQVYRF